MGRKYIGHKISRPESKDESNRREWEREDNEAHSRNTGCVFTLTGASLRPYLRRTHLYVDRELNKEILTRIIHSVVVRFVDNRTPRVD